MWWLRLVVVSRQRSRVDLLVQRCRGALAADLASLEGLRDSTSQVLAAVQLLSVLRGSQAAVTAVRDAAIVALTETGSSYGDIAAITGLTRGRIAQIVHHARSGRSGAPGARGT